VSVVSKVSTDKKHTFVAEVQREEERATGRCGGIESGSYVLNPESPLALSKKWPHPEEEEGGAVKEEGGRQYDDGLDSTEVRRYIEATV